MGAVLLAGGDKRIALEHSRIMIHQPSGGFQGKTTDILITAKEIEKARITLSEILARHTGKTVGKVEEDIENDRFMSAQEALEYGIVDSVLTEDQLKKERAQ
jgi:ATP-dependent Clp protease protease subunit